MFGRTWCGADTAASTLTGYVAIRQQLVWRCEEQASARAVGSTARVACSREALHPAAAARGLVCSHKGLGGQAGGGRAAEWLRALRCRHKIIAGTLAADVAPATKDRCVSIASLGTIALMAIT